MSALVDLILGIVTSIGGFVEAGSISTAAQAGSEFHYQLLWAIAAATLMLAMLAEMSGRLAAVSRRSVAAAVRERFGWPFQFVPLAGELIIDLLLLTAEIGGAGLALKLLTGVGFQWWILPIGLTVWLILWRFGFSIIEYGLGLLGLVTLSFVYSAWHLSPGTSVLARGLVPTAPAHHHVRYAFLAVSILGATVSPYLLNFYSSGTIEEKMTEEDLWVNRITSYLGMCFGGVVSMGVLVTSAAVLAPRHIVVDTYEQAALMFVPVYGRWAVTLFAASLGVGCLGAAVEIALNAGYVTAQVFGWPWGANRPRADAARFTAAFTIVLLLAMAVALLGFDPLRLTLLSVAFTVVIMPLAVLPFLVLMNDPHFVKKHTSGPIGNTCLALLTVLAALFAIAVIPLEVLGGDNLDLVRDLLDKRVLDRNGRELGRVDGIVLEVGGAAPRVAAIEIGAAVLFRRVRPFLGRWAAGVERALGVDAGRPIRIPFSAVLDVAEHVRVDLAARETAAPALEHRLRNVFSAIPGGSS